MFTFWYFAFVFVSAHIKAVLPHSKTLLGNQRTSETKFLKSDKGSCVVILSKADFTNTNDQILLDSSNFQVGKSTDNNQLAKDLIPAKNQILLCDPCVSGVRHGLTGAETPYLGAGLNDSQTLMSMKTHPVYAKFSLRQACSLFTWHSRHVRSISVSRLYAKQF